MTWDRKHNLDAETRFLQATVPGPPPEINPELGECILYTGADNGNGYGQFRYGGRNGYAHRYAWERVNGPIAEGMTVDHLCCVRLCVNVSHMELVTGAVNTIRASTRMTLCQNGHPRTPENLYKWPGGSPNRNQCKLCFSENQKRYNSDVTRARAEAGLDSIPQHLRYSPELRRQTAERIVSGEITYRDASLELGCFPSTLRKWVRRLAPEGAPCRE